MLAREGCLAGGDAAGRVKRHQGGERVGECPASSCPSRLVDGERIRFARCLCIPTLHSSFPYCGGRRRFALRLLFPACHVHSGRSAGHCRLQRGRVHRAKPSPCHTPPARRPPILTQTHTASLLCRARLLTRAEAGFCKAAAQPADGHHQQRCAQHERLQCTALCREQPRCRAQHDHVRGPRSLLMLWAGVLALGVALRPPDMHLQSSPPSASGGTRWSSRH